uniref:Uncharacterized protein n=1 Tax=Acrobeloides nanus TaxID=290746 RepID=A0A914CKC1_9BILA
MLEMPSQINVLTETSYLTHKVYQDINEWTNVKTKLVMPNADLVVPAKKRITVEEIENSTSGITANKEIRKKFNKAIKKLTKTENASVLLVHQECEPMRDLLIVDSLFNALKEDALMKTAVIRVEFPIKIGSITKHLIRLDLLHQQSTIFYALGYDWLIHLIGIPHHIRLDKIPYIDQTARKSSAVSDSESETRSRCASHEHPVTHTHVLHKFPTNITNFEKHVLISKKDEDAINEVSSWVIDEMLQIQDLIRDKRDIKIMFITIPEIGDFTNVFKQFNDLTKNKISDVKRNDLHCSLEILDWNEMISKENKKRVETVDRRLRLLYENCEFLQ